ncbi:MAG: ATP-binding cassette domain-containing protein [Aestuariivita sp.]|nr:ATP-binding cassette domain-containing protein [Aestuariivita sp.]
MVSALFPLRLENAEMRRSGRVLVGPVNLELLGEETTVIIGPNGAGKTSLLKLMHGIGRLSGGRIIWACSIDKARYRQSFVFQTPIIMRRTVLKNLIYPLILRGQSRPTAETLCKEVAEQTGLTGVLGRDALSLSGGEKQKLALARALIVKPEVLFLDEPCAVLDGRSTREIEDILKQVAKVGTCLIMTTHNIGQAQRLADNVVFLLGGRVHECTKARDFFNAPQTTEATMFLNGDIVE